MSLNGSPGSTRGRHVGAYAGPLPPICTGSDVEWTAITLVSPGTGLLSLPVRPLRPVCPVTTPDGVGSESAPRTLSYERFSSMRTTTFVIVLISVHPYRLTYC